MIVPQLKSHLAYSIFFLIVLPLVGRVILTFFSYNSDAISNSAYILGKIGDPIAINNIITAFPRVGMDRNRLAQSLALFGAKAIPNLTSGLASRSYAVKKGCLVALTLTNDKDAIEPLLATLNQKDPVLLTPVIISSFKKIDDPRIDRAILETLMLNEGAGCSNLLGISTSAQLFEHQKHLIQMYLKRLKD